jgi:UPF0755 protein
MVIDDADADDDVVYVADEPGFARKAGAVVAFFLLFVFVVLGLSGYWLYSQINPVPSTDEVTIVIPSDSGLVTIARLLEEQEVISDGTIFRYYARFKEITPIRPGEYDRLYKHMKMDDVITRLQEGPAPIRFTDVPIPEGLWLSDTLARAKEKLPNLDDAELLAAVGTVRSQYQPQGASLDGFLFPATYRVSEKQWADEQALVEQMTRKFDSEADEVGLADGPAKVGDAAGATALTPYDILKVASYVEAEAKVAEDRPRIARVIYNRLKKDMRLEIDATVPFAVGERRPPTSADLQNDSPFNLRRHTGLTPSPINSPGTDSLRAALNPSTEPNADKWLYYVLMDKEGHHAFSQTLEEHNRRVADARRAGIL